MIPEATTAFREASISTKTAATVRESSAGTQTAAASRR